MSEPLLEETIERAAGAIQDALDEWEARTGIHPVIGGHRGRRRAVELLADEEGARPTARVGDLVKLALPLLLPTSSPSVKVP